jgi:hypothetical protein
MFVILLTNRVHAARARRPSKVIADVRADLSDAAAVAVMDDPNNVIAMPAVFRADRAVGWNRAARPVRRSHASKRSARSKASSASKKGKVSSKSKSSGKTVASSSSSRSRSASHTSTAAKKSASTSKAARQQH